MALSVRQSAPTALPTQGSRLGGATSARAALARRSEESTKEERRNLFMGYLQMWGVDKIGETGGRERDASRGRSATNSATAERITSANKELPCGRQPPGK
jgi:hypothetical protein